MKEGHAGGGQAVVVTVGVVGGDVSMQQFDHVKERVFVPQRAVFSDGPHVATTDLDQSTSPRGPPIPFLRERRRRRHTIATPRPLLGRIPFSSK